MKFDSMSDAQLGALARKSIVSGAAVSAAEAVKQLQRQAQKDFAANLEYYYEVKQRLINPGFRTDIGRIAEENEKHFGAPTWEAFNRQLHAYSLQHANLKLKQLEPTDAN